VDRNHAEVVKALRQIGCTVQSLAPVGQGCPDILVGFRERNYVLEIKDGKKPPSERKLTPDEIHWHANWNGQKAVVGTVDEALRAVGAMR
jgi:hypothetical protein